MEHSENDNSDLSFLVGEDNIQNEQQDIYADVVEKTSPEVQGETSNELADVVNEQQGLVTEPVIADLTDDDRMRVINDMFPNSNFESFEAFNNSDYVNKALGSDKLTEDYNDLIDQIESLESKSPEYANDLVKGLDSWMKQGGDPKFYMDVQAVNFDEMSPMDVLVYNFKKDNPTMSEKEIRTYLDGEYQLDPDKYNESEIERSNFKLKLESGKVLGSLKEMQQETSIPDPEKERVDFESSEKERMDNWSPSISKTLEEFKSINLNISDNLDLSWTTTKEEIDSLKDDLYDAIEYSGIELGEDSSTHVQEVLENMYFSKHKHQILRAVAERARSYSDEEWLKTVHNPSAIKQTSEGVGNQPPKSKDDMLLDYFEGN
ncbi:MAG: hypothetical protein HRT87_08525 [Legionellales bacterium]|nr:hypothetical protein [Legionellales bacterium]